MNKYLLLISLPILFFSACKDDTDEPVQTAPVYEAPAFFKTGSNTPPTFEEIAGSLDRISNPQDLDFHPSRSNELWVINKGVNATGGSTVTISNTGTSNQTTEWRQDGNAWHFMALPSAISFSKTNDNFATSANILDANRQGGSFTGPSLWSSDMEIYAQDPGPGLNGSHLDMLHGSPYGLGIESDEGNAFWVFDSYNGHICWYDFAEDHGPGHSNHDDGVIYRYEEMVVSRDPSGIPSHIVEDDVTATLFVCDPVNSRILWMNTLSGSIDGTLPLINELLASHQRMKNVEWGVFTDINLKKPCGIEIIDDILYVSDYDTGEIIAYNKESKQELRRISTGDRGIMGLKADANGVLYYVNSEKNHVSRVIPQ